MADHCTQVPNSYNHVSDRHSLCRSITTQQDKILGKVILLCELEHVEVSYNLIDTITTIIVPKRMQMQCKSNQLDLRALIRLLQSTDHSYYGYTYTPCTAWALLSWGCDDGRVVVGKKKNFRIVLFY